MITVIHRRKKVDNPCSGFQKMLVMRDVKETWVFFAQDATYQQKIVSLMKKNSWRAKTWLGKNATRFVRNLTRRVSLFQVQDQCEVEADFRKTSFSANFLSFLMMLPSSFEAHLIYIINFFKVENNFYPVYQEMCIMDLDKLNLSV